jgi:anaerobic selenocysteine-containing dehydrogenase
MGTIHKTGCVLCAQNCGLEVEVENNRIVKVKPDKSNVRSEGYFCRKGMNIAYHQHNADRLKYPLKRSLPNSKVLSVSTGRVLLPIWGAAGRAATLRQPLV